MIICEVGLNHMGSGVLAKEYTKEIIASGADAITFQIRESEFYKDTKWSKFELFTHEISECFLNAKRAGLSAGIAISDIDYLNRPIHAIDFYKILSKDIDNWELIDHVITHLSMKNPVYFSTGLSSYDQIEKTLDRYKDHRERIRLIHTQLSNEVSDVNLEAIEELRDRFDVPIAFGNHCKNTNIIYSAIPYRPSDFFLYVKHHHGDHPDEAHAVTFQDLPIVVKNLRDFPSALGSGNKKAMENSIEGQE